MTDPDLRQEIGRLEAQLAAHPGSLLFARLADLVRKDGDAGRALEILERGLEAHPEYLSAHIVRARALEDLGRDSEAEEAYRLVVDLDEQNLVALDALARAAERRSDRDAAISWYERLLAVDPRNGEAEVRLQELREGAGNGTSEDGPPEEESFGEEPAGEIDEPPEEAPASGTGEPEPHDAFGIEAGDELRSARWPWDGEPGSEAKEALPSDEVMAFSGDEPGAATDEGVGPGSEGEPGEAFSDWGVVSLEEAKPPAAGEEEPAAEGGELPSDGEEAGSGWEEPEPEPAPEWEDLEARGEDLLAEWDDVEPEEADSVSGAAGEELEEDSDLPTETLANLYASQGLYREAVTIYEELVRRRPHDEALLERLRAAREELDEAVGGGADEPAEPDIAAEPPGESGEEPAAAGAAPGEEVPEPTMREHLLALLRGEAVPDVPTREGGA